MALCLSDSFVADFFSPSLSQKLSSMGLARTSQQKTSGSGARKVCPPLLITGAPAVPSVYVFMLFSYIIFASSISVSHAVAQRPLHFLLWTWGSPVPLPASCEEAMVKEP